MPKANKWKSDDSIFVGLEMSNRFIINYFLSFVTVKFKALDLWNTAKELLENPNKRISDGLDNK